LHSDRLNSPYRHDAGLSNPADQSSNDLAMELRRLLERQRVAHDQYYSLRSVLAKNDANQAGAQRGRHDEHSQSRDRYHRASQFADAEQFHRDDEEPDDARYGARPRTGDEQADYFDRYAAMYPYNEEEYDDPPHKRRRSGLVTALALIVWATVGTAGAYAYRTYYSAPGSTQTSVSPPHAKPAQPAIRGAPPAAAAGGYVVQVSAQRSKADAEASFRSLQDKFPIQLGGRTAIVQRADLGAKGIYYRAMVGPFASAGDAGQFCGRFKAAGGQCIVQRN
jgi:sporulation related protein